MDVPASAQDREAEALPTGGRTAEGARDRLEGAEPPDGALPGLEQSRQEDDRGLPTACQAPEGWLRPRCALASWNEGMAAFSNCGRALAYGPAGAPWSGSNRV